MPELPNLPVVVVHLEDPPGSGLAACCGMSFNSNAHKADWYPNVPRWACTGCTRKAVTSAERESK
jgi:hypothetical protein